MLLVTLEAEEPFLSHSGPLVSCRCIVENWMFPRGKTRNMLTLKTVYLGNRNRAKENEYST